MNYSNDTINIVTFVNQAIERRRPKLPLQITRNMGCIFSSNGKGRAGSTANPLQQKVLVEDQNETNRDSGIGLMSSVKSETEQENDSRTEESDAFDAAQAQNTSERDSSLSRQG